MPSLDTTHPNRRSLSQLRSQRWLAANTMRSFAHRQRLQQMGLAREAFMERPLIGIINTWSDLSPCHAHLRERATQVKLGITAAGGCPFELPAMSLGEVFVKPTTMLYRNFLAMECEELIRSLPLDGVVLLGGCDKTTPGLLMGAISVDIPAIFCPAGPMLNDRWRGQRVGAGTHTPILWNDYRQGKLSDQDWQELEARMTRSPGTCNTMGTASTMTAIVEALGLSLVGAAATPAMDAAHPRMAWRCGQEIVEMVWRGATPSSLLREANFTNAARVWMALGGSTNAAIHLIAMAKRAGVNLTLKQLDRLAASTPVLVNLLPAGEFLMEDFFYAGGVPALMGRLAPLLDLETLNGQGQSLSTIVSQSPVLDDKVIRPLDSPASNYPSFAALFGNLCPDGAVMKPAAASPSLFQHRGAAVVFESPQHMQERIDDPGLEIDESNVLVLRNAGPKGAPGMPEWGALPLPKRLLAKGVKDMVRLSDCRMSGTHGGTCVLHISPEAAIGGNLALVKDGDIISLDLEARSLELCVDESILAKRRQAWQPKPSSYERGYTRLYIEQVEQAHLGADFQFLSGAGRLPEPEIY